MHEFVAIWWSVLELQQGEISIKIEFVSKNQWKGAPDAQLNDTGKRKLNYTEGHLAIKSKTRPPFQYPIRRFIVRSRVKSWSREIGIASLWNLQHYYRGACQIAKWSYNSKYQSRGFETLWDLTVRRLIGYWNRVQVFAAYRQAILSKLNMPGVLLGHRCSQK